MLSFTNISLIPNELLASGSIPVINDGENTRASWTTRSPGWPDRAPGLAAGLGAVIEDPDRRALRTAAAESVGSLGVGARRR